MVDSYRFAKNTRTLSGLLAFESRIVASEKSCPPR